LYCKTRNLKRGREGEGEKKGTHHVQQSEREKERRRKKNRRNVSLTSLRALLRGAEGRVSIRLVSLCRETRTTVPSTPTQSLGPTFHVSPLTSITPPPNDGTRRSSSPPPPPSSIPYAPPYPPSLVFLPLLMTTCSPIPL
jgi:hypothetical protein